MDSDLQNLLVALPHKDTYHLSFPNSTGDSVQSHIQSHLRRFFPITFASKLTTSIVLFTITYLTMVSVPPPMKLVPSPMKAFPSESTVESSSDSERCRRSTAPPEKFSTLSSNSRVNNTARSHRTASPSSTPPSPPTREATQSQNDSSSHQEATQGHKNPAPSNEEPRGQEAPASTTAAHGSSHWPPSGNSQLPSPGSPKSTAVPTQPTTSGAAAPISPLSTPPHQDDTTTIAAPRPGLESYRHPGNFERLFPECPVTRIITLPPVFCEPTRRRGRGASRYTPY